MALVVALHLDLTVAMNQNLDDSLNTSPLHYVPDSPDSPDRSRSGLGSGTGGSGPRSGDIPPPSHGDVFAYVDTFPALSPTATTGPGSGPGFDMGLGLDDIDMLEEGYLIDELDMDMDLDGDGQYNSSSNSSGSGSGSNSRSGSDASGYSEQSFHMIRMDLGLELGSGSGLEDIPPHPRVEDRHDGLTRRAQSQSQLQSRLVRSPVAPHRDEVLRQRLYGSSHGSGSGSGSTSLKSPLQTYSPPHLPNI